MFPVDGEPECFLSGDPRMRPLLLETLASIYEEMSSGEMDGTSNAEGDKGSSIDKEAVVVFNEEEPDKSGPSRPTLATEHAKEVFRVSWVMTDV